MYYVNRSGNGRLPESHCPNPEIDKNIIVYEKMHDTTNPEDERYLGCRETGHPRLDTLAEITRFYLFPASQPL